MTHPDKPGGNKEMFLKMMEAYEIVKQYILESRA
jgi:hypothetical protein